MVSAVSSTLPTMSQVTCFGNQVICITQALLTDVQKIYAAIFYRALSLIAWFFSQSAYLYCRSRAWICLEQSRHYEAYSVFGDRLIYSSINFRSHFAQYEEEASLETIYGSANIQTWLQNHHLLESSSSERPYACCLGISFDFLSIYLRALQNSRPPSEAIELASAHRERGATIEAELAQILGERSLAHVNRTNVSERESQWRPIWDEWVRHLSEPERMLLNQLQALPAERQPEFLRQNFPQVCNLYSREVYRLAYTPVAAMFNCSIQIPPSQPVYLLEEGAYLLTLPNQIENLPAHAIVYIKTAETDFIFDPNYGTINLRPTEAADCFQEFYKDLYRLENLVSLQVLSLA